MKKQVMSVVLVFGVVCLLFTTSNAQPNNAPVNKSGTESSYSFQRKDFSKSYPGKPSAPSSEIIKCIYDKCPQTDKNAPPNPNITKPNPQLKNVIQGKPVSQQPQNQQSQTQSPTQSNPSQPQKDDAQRLKEWSQRNLNSMSVTKTKTIPNPNNAIFVSKPRTEEQPAKKDSSIKYQLMGQDMGIQQTQQPTKK